MNTYAVSRIVWIPRSITRPHPSTLHSRWGLLVNELLTNAFKHAFERGHGVITIECLRQEDAVYRVVVGDDGLGLPSGISGRCREKSVRLLSNLFVRVPKRKSMSKVAPAKGCALR